MSLGETIRRLIAGAAVAGAAVTSLGIGAAHASAPAPASVTDPCTTRVVTKAFSSFWDFSDYFALRGGTFEGAAPGWSLANASLVKDQEPWRVLGSTHASALRLPAGSSATTPASCVSLGENGIRFFYRSPNNVFATLRVDVTITGLGGTYRSTQWVNGAGTGWQASNRFDLPLLTWLGLEQDITITFTPAGAAATWVIDDVMIDPFISR